MVKYDGTTNAWYNHFDMPEEVTPKQIEGKNDRYNFWIGKWDIDTFGEDLFSTKDECIDNIILQSQEMIIKYQQYINEQKENVKRMENRGYGKCRADIRAIKKYKSTMELYQDFCDSEEEYIKKLNGMLSNRNTK